MNMVFICRFNVRITVVSLLYTYINIGVYLGGRDIICNHVGNGNSYPFFPSLDMASMT